MKRYVCEMCHGRGETDVSVCTGEPDGSCCRNPKMEPCPTCAAKGYPPFIDANTPFDNAQIDATKERPDASDVQVVPGTD